MEDVVRLLVDVHGLRAAYGAGPHRLLVSHNRLLLSPPGGRAARGLPTTPVDSMAGVRLSANDPRVSRLPNEKTAAANTCPHSLSSRPAYEARPKGFRAGQRIVPSQCVAPPRTKDASGHCRKGSPRFDYPRLLRDQTEVNIRERAGRRKQSSVLDEKTATSERWGRPFATWHPSQAA